MLVGVVVLREIVLWIPMSAAQEAGKLWESIELRATQNDQRRPLAPAVRKRQSKVFMRTCLSGSCNVLPSCSDYYLRIASVTCSHDQSITQPKLFKEYASFCNNLCPVHGEPIQMAHLDGPSCGLCTKVNVSVFFSSTPVGIKRMRFSLHVNVAWPGLSMPPSEERG